MSKNIIDDVADNIIEGIFMLPIIAVKSAFNFFENQEEKRKLLKIEKLEDMHKLHWREFEKFISFIIERNGFKTILGEGTRDGWIDIHASKAGKKYFIQCKKWKKYKVSEPNIREFLWSIYDFDWEAKWIFVTTSNLTNDAYDFAERNDIDIWDKYFLERYFSEHNQVDSIENFPILKKENSQLTSNNSHKKCIKCGGNMIERIAKKWDNVGNKFYWCSNFPKCRHIENL